MKLRYIMKNGRLYDADTLDEVWPRQRPLPAQLWHDLGPGGLDFYARFLDLWADAEPDMKTLAAEAQAALARLRGDIPD